MKDSLLLQALQQVISRSTGVILYDPQKDEPGYSHASFPLLLPVDRLVTPPHKDSDPFAAAEACRVRYPQGDICLLVPGSRFDTTGTRYGRGGGWYDRFLSRLPQQWTRIGVLEKERLSDTLLVRELWDEPVDWLVVHDASKGSWQIFETRARSTRSTEV